MKSLIYICCIIIGFISLINCASTTGRATTGRATTGRVTTRNTPPRTTPRPTQRTTTYPTYKYCYRCDYGYCPRPFQSNGAFVTRDYSPYGWCVKISDSEDRNAQASRADGSSYCSSRGCSWRLVNGVNKYVCCCSGNLCNSALTTSKFSLAVLVLSLIMIAFNKRYF